MLFTADDLRAQLGDDCLLPNDKDWSYHYIIGQERDAIIVDLLNRIENKDFSCVTGDRSRWEKGWAENLEHLMERGVEGLDPAYIKKNLPLRMNGSFIRASSPYFERNWYELFRGHIFKTYLKGFDHIFEFGCGSGFNVFTLGCMYPETKLTGLDWVQPSVDIVEWLRVYKLINCQGRLFNFFEPDYTLDIPRNSAVLTIGAMEQTGTDWNKFLQFLLKKKPSLVVHSEPIIDFYQPSSLVDWLAIQIHAKRNFWRGYLETLYQLRDEGRIEIIKSHRTGFGSLVLEGYSQLIWRPL